MLRAELDALLALFAAELAANGGPQVSAQSLGDHFDLSLVLLATSLLLGAPALLMERAPGLVGIEERVDELADRLRPFLQLLQESQTGGFGEDAEQVGDQLGVRHPDMPEEAFKDIGNVLALPQTTLNADFHCVTRWSRLDNTWEGVSVKELIDRAGGVKPEARYVVAHGDRKSVV